jgi:hypothetical protein
MGIGNGQLDAAQTAPSELAPELRPEGLASDGRISIQSTSRRPSLLTTTAKITANLIPSVYMSPSAIAAIVLPGRRIGLRLWRHKRRWPLRGIGPIVGIAVDNLGLVSDLDAVFINPEGRRP